MIISKYLYITAFLILTNGIYNQPVNGMIYLKNDKIKVGILAEVGGRMVFFGAVNSANLLKSDSTLWNEPESERIKPSAFSEFKAYNGMITWVGPQSEWWKHQNLNLERKRNGAVWPPDPYLIYGIYNVISKTDTSLRIAGPESPVSGLQLTKEFILNGNLLQIIVSAKNIRNEAVSWDLWSNARFDADTKYMVPCRSISALRIDAQITAEKEQLKYSLDNGVFYFNAEPPSPGKKIRYAKAYITPEKSVLLAVKKTHSVLIEFEKVPQNAIHSEQALVEIYHCISANGVDDLLELEHHSAFKTLQPGETMQLPETWTLIDNKTLEDKKDWTKLLYRER